MEGAIRKSEPRQRTGTVSATIGQFDNSEEARVINISGSLLFTKEDVTKVSNEICSLIKQQQESSLVAFTNRLAVRLSLKQSNKSASQVKDLILNFMKMQSAKGSTFLSLLKSEQGAFEIFVNEEKKAIIILIDFTDDIHVIMEDIKKLFIMGDSSNAFLSFIFALSLPRATEETLLGGETNSQSDVKLTKDNDEEEEGIAAQVSINVKSNSELGQQLFSILAIFDSDELRLAISKIRNVRINGKFVSFKRLIEQKQEFLSWIIPKEDLPSSKEEIELLLEIHNLIDSKISAHAIFESLNTIITLEANTDGINKLFKKSHSV